MALITCEDCGKSISDRAPSCPHCGAPSTAMHPPPLPPPLQQPTAAALALAKGNRKMGFGQKILIGFFGGVVLIVIIGAIGGKTPAPSGGSTSPQTYLPPQKEIVTATAQELFDAYESNEVATDMRLKGKIIQISGRVQSIDKSLFDSMFVSLETRNQFMPTKVRPNKQDESKIAALRRGQHVVFRCQRIQRWVGSPMGEDCVLFN